MSWVTSFQNPGSEFRGAPFWAWNGKLDAGVLRRQIRQMKEAGLGGFFMHSRVGLNTPYLSKEWFEDVAACIDEAKKLGMRAWMYDEDRWPSGAAGGLVTKNPKYRSRQVVVKTFTANEWKKNVIARSAATKQPSAQKDTVAMFTAVIDGVKASRVKMVAKNAAPRPAADESVVTFTVELETGDSWFNGYTYLDTMNPEAVKEFVRVTHEAYRKNIGAAFGKTVPGIFTDEPEHRSSFSEWRGKTSIMWTERFAAEFKKRHGYDLVPRLMELVYDVDGAACTQTRFHFHDCGAALFVGAFGKIIGDWCAKNKQLYTGHLMMEDTISSQTQVVGSCMRFYEQMQAPGMDMLTENWRIFQTAKQVSSAAHQFGRTWRLTETYGCTGWDFPFAGHKALGDWQVALGINLRCQHLAWYTMEGEAKRDYPAAIFHQSPWWNLYPKVEDYFARILSVMTRGEEVRDVLLLHTVESAWTMTRKGWWDDTSDQGIRHLEKSFAAVTDTLLATHLDFDYGDEELLSRHGSVKAGAILAMGKGRYRVVVVPSVRTLRKSTVALLDKFRKAGGTVIFAGTLPTLLDGLPSDVPSAFAKTCTMTASMAEMTQAVEAVTRRVSIACDGAEVTPALYLLREDADAFALFICNTGETFCNAGIRSADLADRTTSFDEAGFRFKGLVRDRTETFDDVAVTLFGETSGTPVELNPETGAIHAVAATRSDKGWTLTTRLPFVGSRLFIFPKKAKPLAAIAPVTRGDEVRSESLSEARWDYRLSEANVAVLDTPAYRIGKNGKWQPKTEIMRLDDRIRDALKIPHRGGSMVQPWAREIPKKVKTVPVELDYAFAIETLPSGDCFLAMERPEGCTATLNGKPVAMADDNGWWCDPSLRKIRLETAALKLGENHLRISQEYPETHSGLEIMYLLGSFGVAVKGINDIALTALPERLAFADWCPQGLPFYAGHVAYAATVPVTLAQDERAFAVIPEYRGVALRIWVDGQEAGVNAWGDREVEITDLVRGKASVTLAVEVIGHRRNSHGALHQTRPWPEWHGPDKFRTEGDGWQDGYCLVPCGLLQPPRLSIRK
ncbi:MAG: hypothetical protein FWF84_03000 [Kiritimatiellaeota bacterium]|nr:hypothetical protein [Kiritimatiellota bacterium]